MGKRTTFLIVLNAVLLFAGSAFLPNREHCSVRRRRRAYPEFWGRPPVSNLPPISRRTRWRRSVTSAPYLPASMTA